MKKIIYTSAMLASLFLISCGGDESKSAATEQAAGDNKPALTVINEADWELKDISTIDTTLHIPAFVVKLPKDATIKKHEALDLLNVTFKNKYVISINYAAVMQKPEEKLKGQVASYKVFKIDTHMDDIEAKVVTEDANGYVYTYQSKAGKDAPEARFFYILDDKTGGYITIENGMSDVSDEEKGDMFSVENVKKIRQIIASSAAFK